MSREQIDRVLNKWASRKLIVFLTSTVGLFTGHITSTDWVIIATAYVAVEGFTKIVYDLKKTN